MSTDRDGPGGSAYGTGAPTYDDAELQKSALDGRLKVAIGIRDRAEAAGDVRRFTKWSRIVNELLDRRLETRGL